MSRAARILVIATTVVFVCLGLLLAAVQTKTFRHIIDDLLYDNRHHYLSCEQLPTEGEVRAVVAQHQDTVLAIEQVHPGFVGVEVDTKTCPGKADLLIWYASHQDRLAIEETIAGDTFFDIPYRLQNR